jgi:drug/metabolite transporter (DMT)-like permease
MDLRKKHWQWLSLLFLSMIWGSSFILMKKGLRSYSSVHVASLRMFFAWIMFLPVTFSRLKRLKRHHWGWLILTGIIGNFLPANLFTLAQTHIDSSLAGILNSLTPLFTLVVGLVFFRSHVLLINIVGLLLGLAGAAGLIYDHNVSLADQSNIYGIFIILATVLYGFNVNLLKYKLADLDGITIVSSIFFFIGPLAALTLLFTGFPEVIREQGVVWHDLGYIALLSLFGSVVAVTLFNILLKYISPIFATSVTYIIPVFAILWGVIDGEHLSADQVLWIFVIFTGVYLVNKQKLVEVGS